MQTLTVFLNQLGARFTSFSWSMLLQATALITLLGILDIIVGRWLRASIRYAVWTLLVLKLMLPVSFSLPTGLFRFQASSQRVVRPATSGLSNPPVMRSDISAEQIATISTSQTPTATPGRIVAPVALSISAILFVAWLAGLAMLTLWTMLQSRKMSALAASGIAPSPELLNKLDACLQESQIKTPVRLRLVNQKINPSICGLFTPIILLPTSLSEALDASQLRAVFLHELTHLKRRDLLVNLIQTCVQIIYFYNPLLWIANRHIRRIREIAVDEAVLVAMDRDADRYPGTLLEVARLSISNRAGAFGPIGIMESQSSLSVRIKRMLSRPFPKSARIGIGGCIVTVTLGLLLLPMARAGKETGAAQSALSQAVETNGLKEATVKTEITDNYTTNSLNPLAVLRTQNVEELFAAYKPHGDLRQRSQKAIVGEILSRTNAIEFLAAKLKKTGTGRYIEPDVKSRLKATVLVGTAGLSAAAALPGLIDELDDEEEVRTAATQAIGHLGSAAFAAIPVLTEEIHFQNSAAAQALFEIDPDSIKTLNLVLDALQDPSKTPDFRRGILNSLWITHLRTPRLLAVLDDLAEQNPSLKEDAVQLRERFRPAKERSKIPQFPGKTYKKEEIVTLIQRLKTSPDDFEAISAITALGPQAAEAVPILMEIIEAKRVRFVGNIVAVFGGIGPAAKDAVPLIMELAKSDEAGVAQNSINTLGRIGPAASASIRLLTGFLTDSDPSFRWTAANALRKIDPSQTARCLPILVQSFQDGRKDVFEITTLGDIGPPAKAAIPALLKLLQTENRDSRIFAARAISKIDPSLSVKTIPVLVAALQDETFLNRHLVANALGDLGTAATSTLPTLKSLSHDMDAELQKAATEAVTKIEAVQKANPEPL
jgi:beta-lactamase regulating signal transducer with metallopeptidase domain/HEAT repeat protein